jgi:hypothetical protein
VRRFGRFRLRSSVGAAILVAASLACGWGDPTRQIRFAEPTWYVVRQGDDVGRIARLHRVDPVDVIDWNGLRTDAPDVGARLLIWPHLPPVAESPAVAAVDAAAPGVAPRPGAAPRRAAFTPEPVGASEPPPPDGDGLAQADASPSFGRPVRVGGAGLLGADTDGSDLDLASASSGLQRRSGGVGEAGFDDDSAFAGGGEAETLAVEERRRVQPTGPQIPDRPVTPPRVARPAPKRCLSGAVSTLDEDGVAREAGLTTSQISAGMAAISRYTPQCFPAGTAGSYSMVVEVTVGCDGRVSNVYTVSPGVIPPRVTACIEQTLASAGFAAHGVPLGMSFQYPMKFRF